MDGFRSVRSAYHVQLLSTVKDSHNGLPTGKIYVQLPSPSSTYPRLINRAKRIRISQLSW